MKRFLASALAILLALGPLSAGATTLRATPSFTHHAAPSWLPGAALAAGPTPGFGPAAAEVLYQSGDQTYRFLSGGWTVRTPAFAVPSSETVLHTDPATGRTWRASVVAACTTHAFTDDGGLTWTMAGTACLGTRAPSLATGPASGRLPAPVYSCAQAATVQCARSADGGATFGPPVSVSCSSASSGAGGVHADAAGVLHVPFLSCGGVVGVAVSANQGLTWTARPIPGATPPPAGFAPDVAATAGWQLYVAYPTATRGVGVARTDDQGATWARFGHVAAAAGIQNAVFHQAVAGDDGRAAVAFLGSATAGDPHVSGFVGPWRLHASFTFDGGATWTTVQTAPDVIQRGWICAGGTGCTSGRNLFESMDAERDAQGRVHVALPDGCVGACATGSGPSTATWATLAVQTGGADLIAP